MYARAHRAPAAILVLVFPLALVINSASAEDPDPTLAKCPGADQPVRETGTADAERAVKCLLDARRGGDGLERRADLDDAATSHNRHMLDAGCFSHECPGEASVEGRIRRVGYADGADRFACGEVLANGTMTPADAVRGWLDSPPHREAILDQSFEYVGIAAATGTPQDPRGGGATYTVDLGHRSG